MARSKNRGKSPFTTCRRPCVRKRSVRTAERRIAKSAERSQASANPRIRLNVETSMRSARSFSAMGEFPRGTRTLVGDGAAEKIGLAEEGEEKREEEDVRDAVEELRLRG